jgi:endonuclease-8
MPEGDTVYLAAKRMAAALSGQRLTRGELRHPRLAEHDLSGRTVLGVHSVGKHLFTRFDDGRSLHTHFRMDGSWHLYQPGQRWRRPNHQARAVLTTQDRVAVGFLLHDMALLATPDEHRLVGHLGPDLLNPDWDDNDAAIAARRLRERPGVELGLALLDQRIMAGVRNLYWAELLVRHRSDSILSGCALAAERWPAMWSVGSAPRRESSSGFSSVGFTTFWWYSVRAGPRRRQDSRRARG